MSDINLWEVIVAKFDELHDRLDKLDDKQEQMNIILAKQEVNLELHMKRTDLLEKKLEPVEKHVMIVNSVLKAIGGLAILVSLVTGIIKLIEDIR